MARLPHDREVLRAPGAPLIAEATAGPVDASPYLVGTPDVGMVDEYARLGALRHSLPALRTGTLTTLSSASVYAFARVAAPSKPVLVVLNKSTQPAVLDFPVRGSIRTAPRLRD